MITVHPGPIYSLRQDMFRMYRLQCGNPPPDYTTFRDIPTFIGGVHSSCQLPSSLKRQFLTSWSMKLSKRKARSAFSAAVATADWSTLLPFLPLAPFRLLFCQQLVQNLAMTYSAATYSVCMQGPSRARLADLNLPTDYLPRPSPSVRRWYL